MSHDAGTPLASRMATCRWRAGPTCRAFVLGLVAAASTAGAEPVVTAKHACVDPAESAARPRMHDAPCLWPLVELPAADAAPPLPKFAPPPADPQAGHAMFWRFPVQPMGPFDAPRHGRR
jgi:hypothetical protein